MEADKQEQMVFIVKIDQFGSHDDRHVAAVATSLWRHLHRGFGADRVEVWHEGQRIRYDPLAHDGEHIGHENILVMDDGYGDAPLVDPLP